MGTGFKVQSSELRKKEGNMGGLWWACPECKGSWMIDGDIDSPPQDRRYCCSCGEKPCSFSPGTIVKIAPEPGKAKSRPFLGVLGEPAQVEVIIPSEKAESRVRELGPYTGEYEVWFISPDSLEEMVAHQGPSCSPSFEKEVFSCLPVDPERRLSLVMMLWNGRDYGEENIRIANSSDLQE
jgi:hypothetical protein